MNHLPEENSEETDVLIEEVTPLPNQLRMMGGYRLYDMLMILTKTRKPYSKDWSSKMEQNSIQIL